MSLDFGDDSSHLVFCYVKLDEYKELGFMERGAEITVLGTITDVDPACATLDSVQLFFTSPLQQNSNKACEETS